MVSFSTHEEWKREKGSWKQGKEGRDKRKLEWLLFVRFLITCAASSFLSSHLLISVQGGQGVWEKFYFCNISTMH